MQMIMEIKELRNNYTLEDAFTLENIQQFYVSLPANFNAMMSSLLWDVRQC
jgi:hypothetical protein